jgi:uracil-DNA glycosylase
MPASHAAVATASGDTRARLASLYAEMHAWARRRDPDVVPRRADTVDAESRLFIVGEAPAADQVRLSGVNWHSCDGRIGPAASRFEPVMAAVGYTVACSGPGDGTPRVQRTAYTTDVYPCYPGHRRAPSPAQIADALGEQFLSREMAIMQPAVILLLGVHSVRAFFTACLGRTPPPLHAHFAALGPEIVLPRYRGATVVPFLHPSGASPVFAAWRRQAGDALDRTPQVAAIRRALADAVAPSMLRAELSTSVL